MVMPITTRGWASYLVLRKPGNPVEPACESVNTWRVKMDKDRIAGATKQNTGAIEEITGTMLGDAKLAAKGKREKEEGKSQNAAGQAKDAAKD